MMLGEGPAAYSSYAAQKRLPAQLRDVHPFPLLPVFVSPAYRDALTRVNVPNTPTTAYRPMSGIAGILMEWGLAGTVLLCACAAYFIGRLASASGGMTDPLFTATRLATMFLFVILIVSSLFRPYFEYQDVMSLFCFGALFSSDPAMQGMGPQVIV
jgi:hypothetical protein